MIAWDVELVDAIARRKCVLVLGSGVSKNSVGAGGKRPPNWAEFLTNSCVGKKCELQINELISGKDYLTACDVLKMEIGPANFIDLIQNEFQRPGYAHDKIHESVYKLDLSIVLSPNFDVIYDCYARSASHGTIVIKDHTSTDVIRYISGGRDRLLIKSHGSVDAPQNIIFTREEYANARTQFRLFYEVLRSLILTHRFLFLGCGIDDPDVRMLFEDVQFAHSQMPLHYFTIPIGEVAPNIQAVVEKTMNLKFYEYDPASGHQELKDSLEQLGDEVEQEREKLATTKLW